MEHISLLKIEVGQKARLTHHARAYNKNLGYNVDVKNTTALRVKEIVKEGESVTYICVCGSMEFTNHTLVFEKPDDVWVTPIK